MKAINVTSTPPGGERIPIADLVPLDTPLVVQIFPIYSCNFKCKYCELSVPIKERGFISDTKIMDFDLFKKCIKDLVQFPRKIKVLRFVGMGEPLLHLQLPEMIKFAWVSNKFERIELITNGSLLTQKLTDALIKAGLTRLCISIQGTSAEKYLEISHTNIYFPQFLDNIRYFYEHRGTCKIHIKIIDCALDGPKDKERFFELFGDMCDTIGIECAGPIHPGVEYNKDLQYKHINQYGVEYANLNICSQPFLFIQINPDGKVVPCYSVPYPKILGDINNESILDIWNGKRYNNFRRCMLNGIKNMDCLCKTCQIFLHRAYPEDNLENKKQYLKGIYNE